MSKKFLIILISIVLIVLIIVFVRNNENNDRISSDSEYMNRGNKSKIQTSYDENTGLYYVEDRETGEIISASRDEEDLKFYESHPDYNPNPLSSKPTDLNSYLPESPY